MSEDRYCAACKGECDCPGERRLVPISDLGPPVTLCARCAEEAIEGGQLMEPENKVALYRRLTGVLRGPEGTRYRAEASEFRLERASKDGWGQFEHRWRRLWVTLHPDGTAKIEPHFWSVWEQFGLVALWAGVIWGLSYVHALISAFILMLLVWKAGEWLVGCLDRQARLREEIKRSTFQVLGR